MAVAALLFFADRRATRAGRAPTGELSPTPAVLDVLFECHSRQFRPRAVLAVVRAWVASGGGRAGYALGRLRLVGASADPHVLCFGPAPNRRFFFCLARAHAVVPYRVEEGRVYVYDPNYPGDRGRFVEFWTDDEGVEFAYDGFRSEDGWGITLLPLSAAVRAADRQNARLARFA